MVYHRFLSIIYYLLIKFELFFLIYNDCIWSTKIEILLSIHILYIKSVYIPIYKQKNK